MFGCRVQDVKLLDITGKAIPVLFSGDNEGIRVDVSGLRQGNIFVASPAS
jgi:hypothetical protein